MAIIRVQSRSDATLTHTHSQHVRICIWKIFAPHFILCVCVVNAEMQMHANVFTNSNRSHSATALIVMPGFGYDIAHEICTYACMYVL